MLLTHICHFIGKAKEDTLNTDIWLYSEAGWTCNEFEDF